MAPTEPLSEGVADAVGRPSSLGSSLIGIDDASWVHLSLVLWCVAVAAAGAVMFLRSGKSRPLLTLDGLAQTSPWTSKLHACFLDFERRLFSWWTRRRCCRVLLLGLDNSGKTEFCQLVSSHAVSPSSRRSNWRRRQPPRPEHHVLHHVFDTCGHAFDLVDPSSHSACQESRLALWGELLRSKPDAVVFVVDASDTARLEDAAEALQWTLRQTAARSVPVLVLGTKIDLRGALAPWDLKCRLGFAGLSGEQREALLGHPGMAAAGTYMPLELRQRIAAFHPPSLPAHAGPLTLQMSSLRSQASGDKVVQWLVASTSPTASGGKKDGDCSGRLGVRFGCQRTRRLCAPSASTLLSLLTCCCMGAGGELSQHADLLPLFRHGKRSAS